MEGGGSEFRDSYHQLNGSEFIPGAAERFKRAVYGVIILIETSSAEDSTFNQPTPQGCCHFKPVLLKLMCAC